MYCRLSSLDTLNWDKQINSIYLCIFFSNRYVTFEVKDIDLIKRLISMTSDNGIYHDIFIQTYPSHKNIRKVPYYSIVNGSRYV